MIAMMRFWTPMNLFKSKAPAKAVHRADVHLDAADMDQDANEHFMMHDGQPVTFGQFNEMMSDHFAVQNVEQQNGSAQILIASAT